MTEHVFLIGAGVVDVLVRPAEREVFDQGSYGAEEIRMSTGGDALNEAAVLARLGKKPLLCTLLGHDEAGRILEEYCRREGISLEYASYGELPTAVNVVLVQKNGERSFLTNKKGTLRGLGLDHIPEVFPKEIEIVCLASMFVSPLLGIPEMEVLFRRVKEQGKILCADMTRRKRGETLEALRGALSYVDYLLPNETEARLLTGAESAEQAACLLWEAGVSHVVIKAGSRGCYVQDAHMARWIPGIPGIQPVDSTGAGDCFAGGFLYALAEGKDMETCARWGNACGSLAVERTGATEGIQNLSEVLERLVC